MFSIRSQDVSWAILYISCWFVGRSSNAAVNWYSMFKCREQRWGPGPQSAQWPTLCSERSHETSLSIIGCSISMNGPVDTIEIRGGQSIAGCCHLLARRHTGMANSSCGKYHAFLFFFFYIKLPTYFSVKTIMNQYQWGRWCNTFTHHQNVYLLQLKN